MLISARPFSAFILKGILCCVLLYFMPACSSGGGTCTTNYWVATTGSDSADGSENNPFLTLEHARDVVRKDATKGQCTLNVNIQGGIYRLSHPLEFTSQDSGAAGAPVVYQAASSETPVISGGKQISGWALVDAGLNIWQAQTSVDTEFMPRQLYVNGVRATRARTVDYPNYYYPGDTGYTYSYLIGSDPQIPPTWNNPTAVEAVTATQWKMMRCPIAEIISNSDVVMQNPCWNNANVFPEPWNFHLLSWWENAYEFLDEPGEWYLNPSTQVLSYIPREGEDLSTADVELPVLETLMTGNGDSSTPISYLNFNGLSFMYATWLAPSSPDGYALDQSGFHLVGNDHSANTIGHDPNTVKMPGSVNFSYAQNISFTDNIFSHLGGAGLDFGLGSQNNEIVNNTFHDISGTGIQLGGTSYEDSHPSDAQLVKDNRIANNLIEYIGQEFWDTAGIYIGFTTNSLIEHNDINHVPWSGIAVGWGWGLRDPGGYAGLPHGTPYEWGFVGSPSASEGNQIIHNHIQYFIEKLWDGGAIYSTGFQGTSLDNGELIAWNLAENKRPAGGGNTFYTDGGSRYITVLENVSLNNPQGTMDFGPCLKASSFDTLCALTGVFPYGQDMGGCLPYGDMVFQNNYLRDSLDFYAICVNDNFPSSPYNMSFIDNVKVTESSQVPSSILQNAGRQ